MSIIEYELSNYLSDADDVTQIKYLPEKISINIIDGFKQLFNWKVLDDLIEEPIKLN